MTFNVSEFTSRGLPYGGARNAYFDAIINTPAGVPNIGATIAVTLKATQLPASTLGSIPIRYFGRETKRAGTRTFQPWQVTVLNDENFPVKHALEVWSNMINKHEANLRDPAFLLESTYRTTATVTQYSKTGGALRTYEFVNIFPVEVGAIEVNWDNGESVEEFQCVFDYDFWRPAPPTITGSFAV